MTTSPTALGTKASLLDWNLTDADTRYLTHSIHRYSGKFIPQIARQAIELLTDPEDLVADPYCGSGTTLLEAALIGRRSIGIDLNPIAVLIAKAKTIAVPISEAQPHIDYLSNALETAFASQRSIFGYGQPPESAADSVDAWTRKWFPPRSVEQLFAIQRLVESLSNPSVRTLATVAFSDILRRSSRAHQGYPNVMFDKQRTDVPEPYPIFLRRLRDICDASDQLSRIQLAPVLIVRGDATAMPVDSESVDAIVTHPPYIGSIPYAEYGSLSLKWLGHEPRELDRRLTGGVRQSKDVVARFELGLKDMLAESSRILRPGGSLFMLVGQPRVRGARVDLAGMATRLGSSVGLRLEASVDRVGANRRANLMGSETGLFMRRSARR